MHKHYDFIFFAMIINGFLGGPAITGAWADYGPLRGPPRLSKIELGGPRMGP